MQKPKRIFMVVLPAVVAVICAALAAGQQPPKLVKYAAAVRATGEKTAEVSASITLQTAQRSPRDAVAFRLVRYEGESFDDLRIADTRGRTVPVTVLTRGSIVDVRFADPPNAPADYSVGYNVSAIQRLRRIPLPTLDAPPPPGVPVAEISIELLPGHVAVGTAFPAISWRDPTHGSARLSAVPSLLLLDSKAAADVTFADRWLDTTTISTAAMFGLILFGSVFWYSRSR